MSEPITIRDFVQQHPEVFSDEGISADILFLGGFICAMQLTENTERLVAHLELIKEKLINYQILCRHMRSDMGPQEGHDDCTP